MELKELTEKTLELFETESADQLGQRLLEACNDTDKLEAFSDLVDGDLTQDWMQKIYQYYLADRKEKKQDYTPKSVAQLMGALIGDDDKIVDMCAGSGALIIQKWTQNPNIVVTALEIVKAIAEQMIFDHDESQHGVSWQTVSMEVTTDEWGFRRIVDWKYRVRDSY